MRLPAFLRLVQGASHSSGYGRCRAILAEMANYGKSYLEYAVRRPILPFPPFYSSFSPPASESSDRFFPTPFRAARIVHEIVRGRYQCLSPTRFSPTAPGLGKWTDMPLCGFLDPFLILLLCSSSSLLAPAPPSSPAMDCLGWPPEGRRHFIQRARWR